MATETTSNLMRGPLIEGTRITVYNLMPYFLDPTATEAYLCRLYGLTPEQVAAARAYAFNEADVVLDQHLRIEERIAKGNPPEVVEQLKKTRETFRKFRDWMDQRKLEEAREREGLGECDEGHESPTPDFPSFREWLAQTDSEQGSPS